MFRPQFRLVGELCLSEHQFGLVLLNPEFLSSQVLFCLVRTFKQSKSFFFFLLFDSHVVVFHMLHKLMVHSFILLEFVFRGIYAWIVRVTVYFLFDHIDHTLEEERALDFLWLTSDSLCSEVLHTRGNDWRCNWRSSHSFLFCKSLFVLLYLERC